jgi:hypothetical protein
MTNSPYYPTKTHHRNKYTHTKIIISQDESYNKMNQTLSISSSRGIKQPLVDAPRNQNQHTMKLIKPSCQYNIHFQDTQHTPHAPI